MLVVADKKQIPQDAGSRSRSRFDIGFDWLSYLNRDPGKVFGMEFVQDHSEAERQSRIHESTPPHERFVGSRRARGRLEEIRALHQSPSQPKISPRLPRDWPPVLSQWSRCWEIIPM
jgi:hypothetical protein